MKIAWNWLAIGIMFLIPAAAGPGQAQTPMTAITFQVNDSMIKGKVIEGAGITVIPVGGDQGGHPPQHGSGGRDPLATGTTDAAGQFRADLPPGKYEVYFKRAGYVPIAGTGIEVGEAAQVITTTMTMMMEEVGLVEKRRVQIVLNWGRGPTQPRDLDAHLACACNQTNPHVHFSYQKHESEGHSADLDVDDTDGGGPETITLLDPPPGSYRYWVHNYSSSAPHLGAAGAVVRVIFGDSVAGEFRMPAGITSRVWLPFKTIQVEESLDPKVLPFTAEEQASNLALKPPPEQTFGTRENAGISEELMIIIAVALGGFLFLWVIRKMLAGKFRTTGEN